MSRSPYKSLRGLKERDQLVTKYLYLPRHVAKRLMHKDETVRRLGLPDAEGVGFLALIRAASLWNPHYRDKRGQPVKFITYAYQVIYRDIWEAAAGTFVVPVKIGKWRKGVRAQPCLGAKALTQWDYEKAPRRGQNPFLDEIIKRDWHQELYRVISSLPFRWRVIVLECISKGRTMEDVGRDLGICKERVRQLKEDAVDWLQRYFLGETVEKPFDTVSVLTKGTKGVKITKGKKR